jgi:hypothetical protein
LCGRPDSAPKGTGIGANMTPELRSTLEALDKADTKYQEAYDQKDSQAVRNAEVKWLEVAHAVVIAWRNLPPSYR